MAVERLTDFTVRPVVERANRTLSCSFCGFATDMNVKSEKDFEGQQAQIAHKCPQPTLSNVAFAPVIVPGEPTEVINVG